MEKNSGKKNGNENRELLLKLKKEFYGDEMEIQLSEHGEFTQGVYFDGTRPYRMINRFGAGIVSCLNIYTCRASDDDPLGDPVTIAPLEVPIIVNFAGTFISEKPLPLGTEDHHEKEIYDYSYEDWSY